MNIVGIGSRKTPEVILQEMHKIGAWIGNSKHWLTSGHAEGADWAFEKGCDGLRCSVFLPWKGYNSHLKSHALQFVVDHTYGPEIWQSIDRFHPAPDKLSAGARKLMARNAAMLMGPSPADVIVCWTEGGLVAGGTGQALRIAESLRIPVINMWNVPTAVQVIERIGHGV